MATTFHGLTGLLNLCTLIDRDSTLGVAAGLFNQHLKRGEYGTRRHVLSIEYGVDVAFN